MRHVKNCLVSGKHAGPCPITDRDVRAMTAKEIKKLERDVADLEAMTHVLLTSRLLDDGHAASWMEASRLARDLPRVRELYGIDS